MKIDFRKIDFRQGKYWFPLVLFVPIVAIAYFSCQMFTGKATDTGVVTDSINTTMPEPEGYGLHNKYAEMEDNLVRGDGYTAINELGEGESQDEEDNVYSESEMDRIDKEKAQKKREEQQMAALQQQLRESRQHINAYDDHYTGSYSSGGQQRDMERFEEEMRQIQERSRKAMISTAILSWPTNSLRKTPSPLLPRQMTPMRKASIPLLMTKSSMTR